MATQLMGLVFNAATSWSAGSSGDGALQDFGTITAGTATRCLRGAVGTVGFHASVPAGFHSGKAIGVQCGGVHDFFALLIVQAPATGGGSWFVINLDGSQNSGTAGSGWAFKLDATNHLIVTGKYGDATTTQTLTAGTWYQMLIHVVTLADNTNYIDVFLDAAITAPASATKVVNQQWGLNLTSAATLNFAGFAAAANANTNVAMRCAAVYMHRLTHNEAMPNLSGTLHIPSTAAMTCYIGPAVPANYAFDGATAITPASYLDAVNTPATAVTWKDLVGNTLTPGAMPINNIHGYVAGGNFQCMGDKFIFTQSITIPKSLFDKSLTGDIGGADSTITLTGERKTVAGPFTLVAGMTNVWTYAGPTYAQSPLYEDGVFMGHPIGASLTGTASYYVSVPSTAGNHVQADAQGVGGYPTIKAALEANPGSWWSDDAGNMYFSTSDGADPNTNGKTYSEGQCEHNVMFVRFAGYCHDLILKGWQANATKSGTLGLQTFTLLRGSAGGLCAYKNITALYGGRHVDGILGVASGDKFVGTGTNYFEQGTPATWFAGAQGQVTASVDFAAGTGEVNAECWEQFNCRKVCAAVGSLDGETSDDQYVWYNHRGAATSQPFANIVIGGGDMSGGPVKTEVAAISGTFAILSPAVTAYKSVPYHSEENIRSGITLAGVKGKLPARSSSLHAWL